MSVKKTTPTPQACSVCGTGRRGLIRGRLNPIGPCLVDANDRHHAGCQDGCDACVAADRIGRRP